MAIRLNLAENGIVGVTELSAASNTGGGTLARNSVNAILDTTDTTYTLPEEGDGEDWAGSVIIVKLLGTLGSGQEITFTSEENIDGASNDFILDADNQVASFYYINNTIGWMAGPATL